MRNAPVPKDKTWAAFVIEGRRRARLSQQALADSVGVNKTTVWRWENEDRRPESAALASKVAVVTHQSEEEALMAAGFAPRRKADEPDPRLEGLDPDDPVVKHIMELDVDEEMRGMMLGRRRQILEERTRADIAEIEFWANRSTRRDEGGETRAA